MQPRFGTLDWGERRNGVLTRAERLHFLSNMAFLAVREAVDIVRTTGCPKSSKANCFELIQRVTYERLCYPMKSSLPAPVLTLAGNSSADCLSESGFTTSNRTFSLYPVYSVAR